MRVSVCVWNKITDVSIGGTVFYTDRKEQPWLDDQPCQLAKLGLIPTLPVELPMASGRASSLNCFCARRKVFRCALTWVQRALRCTSHDVKLFSVLTGHAVTSMGNHSDCCDITRLDASVLISL